MTLGNSNILRSNTASTGIGIKAEDALTHIKIDANYGTETIIDEKSIAIENKNAKLTVNKAQITNNTTGIKNLSTNSQAISIENTLLDENTKAIHNLGTSTATINRNKFVHSNPAINTTFSIDNEQESIISLEANCITQLYNSKGLVQIKSEIDDCTKTVQQIESADTKDVSFTSEEKEGLAEVATDKIIVDSSNPKVHFLKEENTKAVVGDTFTKDNGDTINLNNVTITNSQGSTSQKNLRNIKILNKQINITQAVEFQVNDAVQLTDNKFEISNDEDLNITIQIPKDTILFTESAYDGFNFDKISDSSGAFKELIDESNIIKLGSYSSQLLFNKPIEICFENNIGLHWAIQNQPGDRFYPINGCSGSVLGKNQDECFYQEATTTCIVTNHASIVAQANEAIPAITSSGSTAINTSGATRQTFSNETSDKQLKLNVEKSTTFENYINDKIIIKNISKDKFAETSLPSQIIKTFEIGKRALDTNKDLRVTYLIPNKYKDQTSDLALYQYDLSEKVYKLLDASPNIVDNKAYFNSNTSGTMAILITNYKRDILKTQESLFEIKDQTDPTLPWYSSFMKQARKLEVINITDQALSNVTRGKLSDMITKLLEIELDQQADNPFIDIYNDSPYKDSILTLKKLGVIKGYSDSTFRPYQEVTRAEALKIVLMTAAIPSSTENSIFEDVTNDQWFTKFIMAANKLGIVKGYQDGEFKPFKTITISEMTKVLLKVKDLKANALVSKNPFQKLLEAFSFR